MQAWVADFRYAWRKLFSRACAGGTLVAIVSIGLGVGVSAAIFGAVDRVLLETLPYPEPQRVTVIEERTRDRSRPLVAYGTFVELEQRNRSFEALAVRRDWQPVLVPSGEPARLDGEQVSPDYFRVLGVPPSLGRDFVVDDEVSGAPRVAIVTEGFAQRRFGSAEAVLGRAVLLDREEYTVVGVMPREFENALAPSVEIWTPLRLRRQAPFNGEEWGFQLRMVGRLRAGVSLEQAQVELTTFAASPVTEFPRAEWVGLENGLLVERLQASVTSEVRPTLLAILGAVLLLLVIACANVTNILVARALARRGELAMRAVLGAGRSRLVQQLFTESALLALFGGALGVVIAALASRALVALAPDTLPRLDAIGFDGRVFAFAVAIAAVIAVVVGLVPALRARGNVADARIHVGARSTASGLLTLRRALVVGQVALATVLLASAGLLLRSVERIFTVPTGFDASQVVAMQVVATGTGLGSSTEFQVLYEQVLEAVRAVPGVVEAALTNHLPLSGSVFDRMGVVMEATPGDPSNTIFVGDPFRYTITPGWFDTMGIPLVRGRLLGPEDVRGAPQAILVNESFAAARLDGRDPIGQRVRIGGNVGRPDLPPATIVGVVGDVRHTSLASAAPDAFYVRMGQWTWVDNDQTLVVRAATGDPGSLVEPIKQAIWSVNAALPVTDITMMADLVAKSEARRTFALAVFAAFGLAALLLAGVGVYGVIEERVTERTREIGLRAAVGATPARLAALIVRQGLILTVIGVAIGIGVAASSTRAIASLLFGIEPFDLVTYGGVVALLLGITFIACYAPALRAARIDPAITLRAE
jgi:putative ABC transport system permease protein